MEQFLRATELSYRRYQTMVGPRYAVRWIKNYALTHEAFDENDLDMGMQSPIRKYLPEMRDLTESEHPFSGYEHVREYQTMLIEPPTYLNAMLTDFRIAGGSVRRMRFENPAQLQQLAQPVIFNCTGLGAKALFDDQELIPIKGQLTVLLPQSEVDYLMLTKDALYMFPRSDGILLGGSFEKGEWSLDVDQAVKARVLEGHAKFFGSFRRCASVGDQNHGKSKPKRKPGESASGGRRRVCRGGRGCRGNGGRGGRGRRLAGWAWSGLVPTFRECVR
jgi:hypothetical protein